MRWAIGALALLAGVACGTSASAKTGDRAWAACIWRTVPTSAANWLAMTPPTWQDRLDKPAPALGLRLTALCGAPPAVELKPNRYYNFKALAATLKAARPKGEVGSDQPGAVTELCGSAMDDGGVPFTFRHDVVRVEAGTRTTTFQQYYAELDGQAVPLPQDLRVLPRPGQTVTVSCRRIAGDGTLGDA